MSKSKSKPTKNRGDTWMAVGALMVALSIILDFIGIEISAAVNQGLLWGGLILAILGVGIRSSLRSKEKKKSGG